MTPEQKKTINDAFHLELTIVFPVERDRRIALIYLNDTLDLLTQPLVLTQMAGLSFIKVNDLPLDDMRYVHVLRILANVLEANAMVMENEKRSKNQPTS